MISQLYDRIYMKVIASIFALLVLPPTLCAQTFAPTSEDAGHVIPRANFVLHDQTLHTGPSRTVLGPMTSDGKGNTTGTVAVYGGSNLIQVLSLSFSSDGKLLAVGSTPGLLDIWDVEKRSKVRSFTGGTTVALSSDGRLLAKDGNGIDILDVPTGALKLRIKWTGDIIRRLSFDPKSKWILVSANGEDDRVFDISDGRLVADLKHTRQGRFSVDGALIVGADYQHLVSWDTQDWKVVRDLPNGPEYVTTIAVEADKNLVLIGGPDTARLRKITSGEQVAQVGSGYTNFAAFNRSGSFVLTYTAKGFGIWNTEGKRLCTEPEMGNGTMAISPDDRWLAAAPLGKATDVEIWDVPEMLSACLATR